jgi:hypothetical protein
MRKQLVAIFIIATILLIPVTARAQHAKFIFSMIKDRAVLSRSGGSTWLALGMQPVEVKPGDLLKVEGEGRGELRYPDGTIVRLSSGASITILRSGVQLQKGYIWLKVRRRADMFKVFSPLGSCSVLGTSFDVNVDRFGKTSVRVFSGIVAVRANDDSRNRQLVLQSGMRTVISEKTRIDDKPMKFQASTIEAKLLSDWESRKLDNNSNYLAAPKVDDGLPPMLPELDTGHTIMGREPEVEEKSPEQAKADRIQIIARQRNSFLENLRKQELKKNSVIGSRFEEKDYMRNNTHGYEFGQYKEPSSFITDDPSLRMEYFQIRNRLLRVQSQIRQKEMEMTSLVNQTVPTSQSKRDAQKMQADLLVLQQEHKQLILRLRNLQTRKR